MPYTIKIELYRTHAGLHVADVYRISRPGDEGEECVISRSGTYPDAAAEAAIHGYRALVARERAGRVAL